MNTLFQKFLFSYLRDNLDGWTVKSEPTYAIDSEREIISHPDIVIRKGGKDALVIDAKYKQPRVGDQGINSDVYQIHTYSVGLRVPIGILVYPKHETPLAFKERHSIDRTQILIWTIDLSKPRLEFVRECDYFVSRVSDLLRNRIIGEFLAR
jgi:5-methylcytosine-specific restriction endonuclease McrBC regulatory subunit McrC